MTAEAMTPASLSDLIAELRALAAAATHGPWRIDYLGGCSTILTTGKPARNDTSIPAYAYDETRGYCIGYPALLDGHDGRPELRKDFVCFSHRDAEYIVATQPQKLLKLLDALQASQPCGAAGDVTRANIYQALLSVALQHEDANARCCTEMTDAVLALLRSQPTAQGWSIPLGTPIKYRVGGKYPEWERGGPYYFAGISTSYRAGRVGQASLWVADEWPVQHGGNITDDFDPDEWEIAPPQPGKGEGNG